MHVAEQGSGPLVVLLHGFPESWYSWRHQFAPLAAAGYRVVAPDQRGYGGTDRPEAIDAYTQLHLVGDVIGLLDALGEQSAVLVGHDWGAPVAWNTALLRPDRIRGVAGLSVPYVPRGTVEPVEAYRKRIGDRFYMLYFQEPGRAEAALERDVKTSLRRLLTGASGDAPPGVGWPAVIPEGSDIVEAIPEPETLPAWLTEFDLEVFAQAFEAGFGGGLNWYRNLTRSWELMAAWKGAPLLVPALYMVGDRDGVYHFMEVERRLPLLSSWMPGLTRTVVLPGCGHWTQQERPAEVNSALLEFLAGLA